MPGKNETVAILDWEPRRLFLLGMRFFFGGWLLYIGLVKWISIGPSAFVGFITSDFDKTWSPHALNAVLAWLILIAEPGLGLFILSGVCARLAWLLTSMLMFMLVMGQTLLMKPDVVANWQYLVLTLACAALSGPVRGRDTQRIGSG